MFLFYVLTFFKKGDIIQGGTLFMGGHYLRKYGNSFFQKRHPTKAPVQLGIKWEDWRHTYKTITCLIPTEITIAVT